MTRVVVIGRTGQFGSELVKLLEEVGTYSVVALGHDDIECTDLGSVREALHPSRAEIVVNCDGFVRVDACEEECLQAFAVNAVGSLNVARVSSELHALSVYVSTDYVFDGEKGGGYTENDTPRPINIYGTSKLAGELLVRQAAFESLILRMASLFGKSGSRGKGTNFVDTIVTKARESQPLIIVDDVRMSPTYAPDAAWAVEQLLRQRVKGIVHVTNTGSCTWYEFARKTLDLLDLNAPLRPVRSHEYPMKASRPRDSSLSSRHLPGLLCQPMRSWEAALEAYLVERGHKSPLSPVPSSR